MIDTIYFHWLETGGLYDISKTTTATTKQKPSIIKCLYRNKHTFAISRSKSQKGVEATLWDIPQWLYDDNNINDDEIIEKEGVYNNNQTKRRLLVFNTHLDSWDTMNRKKQVNEILDFIDDTLRSIEEEVMINNVVVDDDNEEETGQQRQQQRNWWSNTGVLVVGDFNIKAGSTEYHETLMSMSSNKNDNNNNNDDDSNRRRHHQCNWKDYFFGIEEGDNNESANVNVNDDDKSKHINLHQHQHHTYSIQNSLVEYPNDCGRIDYIFGIQDFTTSSSSSSSSSILNREYQKQQQEKKNTNMNSIISNSSSRTFMTLDKVSQSIRKEPIGDESSDHYALILDLIPRRIVS
jgi:endonuclease/exonuclease/phosphatase family metal-dependent hydrolase